MYVKPASKAPSSASAVIYSFQNTYGQKQKVGVVYNAGGDRGPQVNQVYHGANPKGNVLSPTPIPLPISRVNQVRQCEIGFIDENIDVNFNP